MELAKQDHLTDLPTRIVLYQVAGEIQASTLLSPMMDDAFNLIVKDGLKGRKVSCKNCKLGWKCLKVEKDSSSSKKQVDDSALICWREKVVEMFPFIKLE